MNCSFYHNIILYLSFSYNRLADDRVRLTRHAKSFRFTLPRPRDDRLTDNRLAFKSCCLFVIFLFPVNFNPFFFLLSNPTPLVYPFIILSVCSPFAAASADDPKFVSAPHIPCCCIIFHWVAVFPAKNILKKYP